MARSCSKSLEKPRRFPIATARCGSGCDSPPPHRTRAQASAWACRAPGWAGRSSAPRATCSRGAIRSHPTSHASRARRTGSRRLGGEAQDGRLGVALQPELHLLAAKGDLQSEGLRRLPPRPPRQVAGPWGPGSSSRQAAPSRGTCTSMDLGPRAAVHKLVLKPESSK